MTNDEVTHTTAETTLVRHQSIRLQRFGMAMGTYAIFFVLLVVFVEMGIVHFSPLRWTMLLASCILTNMAFWAAFRSNFNLRFADPSLTASQIVASSWWGMIPLDAVPEQHRAILLMLYLGAVIFGILQLNTREYLRLVAFIMLGYTALLTYEAQGGKADFHLGYEIFLFSLYGTLLVWISFFGGFVNSLKREINTRKLELEVANEKNRLRATTDDLTELFNRRHAMEALQRMTAVAQRYGFPLSVAILDLDHFKSFNDRYGHATGDVVLREFSRWLCETLRACDTVLSIHNIKSEHGATEDPLVARFGGEEFVILLPGTSLTTAHMCLERLRSNATVRVKSELVSFSAGLASYRTGESVESLLARADKGLYAAKHAGRDQVRTVETPREAMYSKQ